MGALRNVQRPLHGEYAGRRWRARCRSTAVTPSIVQRALGHVGRPSTTLRWSAGRIARVCSSIERAVQRERPASPRSSRAARGPPSRRGSLPRPGGTRARHREGPSSTKRRTADTTRSRARGHRTARRARSRRRTCALAADDLGAQPAGEALGLDGRAHRDERQIGAPRYAQVQEQREREVPFEVALVHLVEDDRTDIGQLRVAQEPPGEHALGHEDEARRWAHHLLEAHRVADRLAGALAQLLCDAERRHLRGDAAWLQHEDLLARRDGVEQRSGHARRLARRRAPRRRRRRERGRRRRGPPGPRSRSGAATFVHRALRAGARYSRRRWRHVREKVAHRVAPPADALGAVPPSPALSPASAPPARQSARQIDRARARRMRGMTGGALRFDWKLRWT